MDTDRLLEVVPHYLAMLLLVFVVLAIVRAVAGDLGFWFEFVFVLIIAFAYRPVVLRLGVAPSAWERN